MFLSARLATFAPLRDTSDQPDCGKVLHSRIRLQAAINMQMILSSPSHLKHQARRAVALVALLLLALVTLHFHFPSAHVEAQDGIHQVRRVLVISLDGLDARYLQKRDEYKLRIPTLRRLMAEGATAHGVISVYPSLTYPAHTTIVTGAFPIRHGIFGNDLFEPPGAPQIHSAHWFARDIRAETLWDAAALRGLSTGLVSWPVAVGAGAYNVPEIWKPGGSQQETLAVIKTNARPPGLVEEIERHDPELYRNVNQDEGDDMRTRFAEYIIERKRPEVMLVHLFDLDHFEHIKGPFTPEAFAELEKLDGDVARLLAATKRAGTFAETTVFIVSDHGFLPISKLVQPGVLLARAGLLKVRGEKDPQGRPHTIITGWRAMPYVTGGSCAIILRDPHDHEALDKVRDLFKSDTAGENRTLAYGLARVLESKEVRQLGGNPHAALVLEAADGYAFGSEYTGEPVTPSRQRGQHGYLPSRYYASFIASGAGVTRRGQLNDLRMVDVGPTVARLLGLTLHNADGHALSLR